MDSSSPETSPSPAPGTSFMTVLAFLGLLAITAGWFLPAIADIRLGGGGASKADLERLESDAKKNGISDDVVASLKRMQANEAVSARDFEVVGSYYVEKTEGLDPKERRGWTLALAVLRWTPWAALGAAALLALGRLRKPGFLTLTLVLSIAIVVGGMAGLLVLGSSQQAKDAVAADPKVLGVGIYAIALGGLAAFLGGLFAVRRGTWWKAYLLTIVVVAAVVMGAMAYVDPK